MMMSMTRTKKKQTAGSSSWSKIDLYNSTNQSCSHCIGRCDLDLWKMWLPSDVILQQSDSLLAIMRGFCLLYLALT